MCQHPGAVFVLQELVSAQVNHGCREIPQRLRAQPQQLSMTAAPGHRYYSSSHPTSTWTAPRTAQCSQLTFHVNAPDRAGSTAACSSSDQRWAPRRDQPALTTGRGPRLNLASKAAGQHLAEEERSKRSTARLLGSLQTLRLGHFGFPRSSEGQRRRNGG